MYIEVGQTAALQSAIYHESPNSRSYRFPSTFSSLVAPFHEVFGVISRWLVMDDQPVVRQGIH